MPAPRHTLWLARFLGGFFILGGLGHFFGITRLWLAMGMPERRHAGFAMFIGAAQLVTGSLDLAVAGALGRGERSAGPVSAIALGLIAAYAGIVLPVLLQFPIGLILVPPLLYPALQLALVIQVFRAR